jgi:hypothetical protein
MSGCIQKVPCTVYVFSYKSNEYRSVDAESIREASTLVHGIRAPWMIATERSPIRVISKSDIERGKVIQINKRLRKYIREEWKRC